jgi:spermidine synthase
VIKTARPKTNHDLAPIGLYYALAYDNALHGASLKGIFTGLEKYGHVLLFLLSAGMAAAGFMLRRRYAAIPVLFVTLTTGFSVMVLELLLIFVYQAYSGYVFHEIGMLMTMLMAGMAAGALAAGPFSKRFGMPVRSLITAEIALAATSITVPALFLIPGIFHGPEQALLRFLLFTLLFIAGFFTGIEFPLATEIYGRLHTERTAAGPVYGIDLAGGFMGGIAGGFFLFPLMGLTKTCIFLFALKVCGIVMLFCGRRK